MPEEQAQIDQDREPRDLAYEMGAHMPYIHPRWPERFAPLQDGIAYRGESGPDFCASYGGYNVFRRDLAALVGVTDLTAWWEGEEETAKETPFFELLNFADNEGAIGTGACAELARDFAEWQTRADIFAASREYGIVWRNRYEKLRKVFEWATDGGWVDFH